MDRQKDLIEVPRVAWSGTPATSLVGLGLPELPAPLPNRFVGHGNTACKQQLFHIAIAEAEPEIEPDRVADNLCGEAMILVWVGWHGGFHRASMPHRAEPV